MFKPVKAITPNALVSGLAALLMVLFTLKGQLMLTDTDFWWHLAAGDLIRKSGEIPVVNSFSFAAGNYPWLNISWLWDVIYSWLNSVSPLYLPITVTAIINSLVLSILTAFMLKRGVGIVLILALIFLSLAPYAYMLSPRPHQVTFLMVALFYIISQRISEGRDFKYVMLLPPLMIIWANMHGGFLAGLIVIGAYTFQSLLKLEKRKFLIFLLAGITCVVATLINPFGVNIYKLLPIIFTSKLFPIISEWQPMKLNAVHVLHILYLALFLITFRPLNKEVSVAEKILSLFWMCQTLSHERNLPIFIILSAPVFALNLKQIFISSVWLKRKNEEYAHDLSKIKKPVLVISIFVVVILLSTLPAKFLSFHIPQEHPVAEAEFIKQNYPNKNFLNDYFQGGYLLYVWHGQPKIFIDGRAETAYPPDIIEDYLRFHYNEQGWETLLDKYKIDAIVLPKSTPQINYFTSKPEWAKVYDGPYDAVFIKRK